MRDFEKMETPTSDSKGVVKIGQSLFIRGDLTGSEDLTIEGRVDGKIDLTEHNLTIGPKGRIQAEIIARTVVVNGEITGNIRASEKVELAATSRVSGDIVTPRILIADGARLKGSVDTSGARDASRPAPSPEKSSSRPAKTAGTSTSLPERPLPARHRSTPASP